MPIADFRRVLIDVEDRILSGELSDGAVLPSGRELAEHYAVSLSTIDRAMTLLMELGIITGRQGKERRIAAGAHSLVRARRSGNHPSE